MDHAHFNLIRDSVAGLRRMGTLANSADERERLALIERWTREMDGADFEFRDEREVKKSQGGLF